MNDIPIHPDDKSSQIFIPDDLYEDVFFHPCLCIGVSQDDDEIWGVSLIDGSYPRSCSLAHSAIRKLSTDQAWEIKKNYQDTYANPESDIELFGPTDN
jgi:hypothetical protein